MRLIIEYQVSDGCTYSCTVTQPVVYESAEHFAVDFEQFCRNTLADCLACFPTLPKFAGIEWDPTDFITDDGYFGPQIMTVDEYFEQVEK